MGIYRRLEIHQESGITRRRVRNKSPINPNPQSPIDPQSPIANKTTIHSHESTISPQSPVVHSQLTMPLHFPYSHTPDVDPRPDRTSFVPSRPGRSCPYGDNQGCRSTHDP